MGEKRGNVDYSHIILADTYLLTVYKDVYKNFKQIARNLGVASTSALEIGAGDFSLAEIYFDQVIKTDIESNTKSKFGNGIDSQQLPYKINSFDIVIAKDSLHHFKDPYKSLNEIHRVLKPGGIFIVSEPYWSLLGRFIFNFLHPEKWDTNPQHIEIDSSSPWESNQALLYLLKGKFSKEFESKVPGLKLNVLNSSYGISYALSGGVFARTIIPSKFLLLVYKFEKKILLLTKPFLGLNIYAVFTKEIG
jgi:SAM-dependent methyltransferase